MLRAAALVLWVGQSVFPARQEQFPTAVVGNFGGIVEPIAVRQERFFTAQVAQRPKLLSPSDMADFPERRIDDRQARADHLLVVEIGHESQQARAEVAHGGD
jgi:hypothetical protein